MPSEIPDIPRWWERFMKSVAFLSATGWVLVWPVLCGVVLYNSFSSPPPLWWLLTAGIALLLVFPSIHYPFKLERRIRASWRTVSVALSKVIDALPAEMRVKPEMSQLWNSVMAAGQECDQVLRYDVQGNIGKKDGPVPGWFE
jgi:hypothetical protein